MVQYEWNFDRLMEYTAVWRDGVYVTVWLSLIVIAGGTALGITLYAATRSRVRPVAWLARIYIDVFRAIPALVLIGTFYFCLPIMTGVPITATATAVLALSANLAPFAAESIRAGVESVPTVQYESGVALGFRGWRLFYYVIGPQAVRRILPGLAGEWVTTLKLTSLAATVGVTEIWNVTGQVVAGTALPLEARLVGAGLYVAIILPCLWGVALLERRFHVEGIGRPVMG